jgi:hypothetical protein
MKTAKRVVLAPVSAPHKASTAELKSLAAQRDRSAANLVEGKVCAVDEQGVVQGVLAGGERVEALSPAHVDLAWLREAAAREPVAAAFAVMRPSGRYVLWGVFPSAAHADVKADVVIRGRNVRVDADSLQLTTRGGAQIKLEADGNATIRGRDLTSHARRVNRIKGGAIRLN